MEGDNKLPVEFKEKWVTALRSGIYEQGVGYLMQDNKYCCLGVACVIMGIEPRKLERLDEENNEYGSSVDPYELISAMPSMLKRGIPKLIATDNDIVSNLTYMNDGCGKWTKNRQSFQQIADWIDTNL